jgi:hypothetical protein
MQTRWRGWTGAVRNEDPPTAANGDAARRAAAVLATDAAPIWTERTAAAVPGKPGPVQPVELGSRQHDDADAAATTGAIPTHSWPHSCVTAPRDRLQDGELHPCVLISRDILLLISLRTHTPGCSSAARTTDTHTPTHTQTCCSSTSSTTPALYRGLRRARSPQHQ